MAAGLGFKTFTTGEVLTAADTNGYLMQGVLVFASSATRDAAITSPQEGQFAYLKDTNVTTYYTGSAWANLDTTGMTNPMTTTGDTIYSSSGSTPARLGIGSTGQVLTVAGGVPTWATSSSGSMTLLSTTTLSGASTTISGISGAYKDLLIQVTGINPNIAARPRIAPNGSTTITDYGMSGYDLAVGPSSDGGNATYFYPGGNALNWQAADTANAMNFYITNYASSSAGDKMILHNIQYVKPTNNIIWYTGSGMIKTTSAISSLVFSFTSTATYSGGTVKVIGVN